MGSAGPVAFDNIGFLTVKALGQRIHALAKGIRIHASFQQQHSTGSKTPEQISVDLLGRNQVFQLLQPGEGAKIEAALVHSDSRKHFVQLGGALFGVPCTRETRKLAMNLVEAHAIAAVVASARTD